MLDAPVRHPVWFPAKSLNTGAVSSVYNPTWMTLYLLLEPFTQRSKLEIVSGPQMCIFCIASRLYLIYKSAHPWVWRTLSCLPGCSHCVDYVNWWATTLALVLLYPLLINLNPDPSLSSVFLATLIGRSSLNPSAFSAHYIPSPRALMSKSIISTSVLSYNSSQYRNCEIPL